MKLNYFERILLLMRKVIDAKNMNLSVLGHPGLERLVMSGIQKILPTKVVLFGSRARKTNRESSDFDIAFFFSENRSASWTEFLFQIEDSPLVLFNVDWIDANRAQPELRSRIDQEGIVLYESK